MRIVVTGREGQVVSSLIEAVRDRHGMEVVALGRPDLDLADTGGIYEAIARTSPDVVVSAAAYTAVDQAEDEPDLAFRVNADGAGAVASAAARLGVPVVHLSTDYVFSGDLDRPYVETDPTGPVGVYGASKLAGEQAVASANPRHVILRTAWVYSPFGKNFVKTMLRLAADRGAVSVVADQIGNPTSALDIADGILSVAAQLTGDDSRFGLYHLAGTGETSWAGFASHIFDVSQQLGGPFARVNPINTSDYPTKARRPANSRLQTTRLSEAFGWTAPDWRGSSRLSVRRNLLDQTVKNTL